jgi:hypothetical protein
MAKFVKCAAEDGTVVYLNIARANSLALTDRGTRVSFGGEAWLVVEQPAELFGRAALDVSEGKK